MRDLEDFFKLKKFEFDEKNHIRKFYDKKKPFTYSFTSGSSKITTADFKKGFYGQNLDFSVFPIYRKLCKNLELVDINLEGRNRSDCNYVGFNDFLLDYHYENWDVSKDFLNNSQINTIATNKVYGVDITMAYPTIALNLGWIDSKDFEKLKKIDKISRLACFGMLATKTYSISFDGENFSKLEKKINPFANFFYRLVYETDILLINCLEKFKDYAIFYWVDCIFFHGKKNIPEIKNYFLENNLQTSVFQCFEFEQIFDTKTIFRFSYKKRKKNAVIEKKEYIFNTFYKFHTKKEYLKLVKKIV